MSDGLEALINNPVFENLKMWVEDGQLTEEELVYAEDLTIKAGESFDLETDYRGFQKNDEKVKVTFLKAEGDSGNSFDFNTPGSYQAFYRVDPLSGNPSYQIMRRIVVEA